MSAETPLEAAAKILNRSVLKYRDEPVGTVAALPSSSLVAVNYAECFVRDFVPSAFVFLMRGETAIVRNFLNTVLTLSSQQTVMKGHERAMGLMPASFKIVKDIDNKDRIVADFGERAIGRVAPVDSAMWWMIILRVYVVNSGDLELAHSPAFQKGMRQILQLYLKESFETSPAMLVPDGSFMIDRRMGVSGHPLEIQSLFYGMLQAALELLVHNDENERLIMVAKHRMQTLRSYVRIYYWLDIGRLNEIHRFGSEEFGPDAKNLFNIYPETIPEWIDGWLPPQTGYFIGNLGPGKMDFRLFSSGNLLAIMFGLATEDQSRQIMKLYETNWDSLIGNMPLKLVYPALAGKEWSMMTGSDPKNVAWSYHNGGSWPMLIWMFAGAAIRAGRDDLAKKVVSMSIERLHNDEWAEYYDGKRGDLIGRRANLNQTWSATSLLVANELIENPDSLALFESLIF